MEKESENAPEKSMSKAIQKKEREFLMSDEYIREQKMAQLLQLFRPKELLKEADRAELENKTPKIMISPFFGELSQENQKKVFRPFVFDIEQSIFLKYSNSEPVSEDLYSLIQNLKHKIKSVTEYVDNDFMKKVKNMIIPDGVKQLEMFLNSMECQSIISTDRFSQRRYYLENYVFNKY